LIYINLLASADAGGLARCARIFTTTALPGGACRP